MYFRSSSDILAGRTKSVQIDIAILGINYFKNINANCNNKLSMLNLSSKFTLIYNLMIVLYKVSGDKK